MSQEQPEYSPQLNASLSGTVGYLRLENPSKHNALTQSMWQSLPDKIEELLAQHARVIIIEGEGANFCAGADISEFSTVRKNEQTARVYEAFNADAFSAIAAAPVPVIAKIRGYCLGGGFGIAAACDIRYATTTATFAVPAARLGLAYPLEAMADIVNAVGSQNAKRLLFTADRFSADSMLKMGFISELAALDELDQLVDTLANKIAALAPLTHRASKAAIAAVLGGDKKLAIRIGNATFVSDDYAEGRRAFAEKRLPTFTGS